MRGADFGRMTSITGSNRLLSFASTGVNKPTNAEMICAGARSSEQRSALEPNLSRRDSGSFGKSIRLAAAVR